MNAHLDTSAMVNMMPEGDRSANAPSSISATYAWINWSSRQTRYAHCTIECRSSSEIRDKSTKLRVLLKQRKRHWRNRPSSGQRDMELMRAPRRLDAQGRAKPHLAPVRRIKGGEYPGESLGERKQSVRTDLLGAAIHIRRYGTAQESSVLRCGLQALSEKISLPRRHKSMVQK